MIRPSPAAARPAAGAVRTRDLRPALRNWPPPRPGRRGSDGEDQPSPCSSALGTSSQEAAGGSTEIATNITGVSAAASSTTQALGQTRMAVDELSRMASDLHTTVGRFTC